jgi:cytochrome c-type biogenesis protein CcmH/NrfG
MAIISLRAYNREIEGMIDNGQLDEAVAHCRHILATFPKHIASYRLLGKAHLEQQRISDATDIFQRVLSAIPDDFISNVGMSIIREDENNLDAAIWHMELAYETQPANIAIQDELRRLFGRRDGLQPPKPRLTRGALARMYIKGGIYDQAIAELRAAIAEDPNRPDLQLLLAQMFFQTSQRVEAVDTCVTILKKMPLCLEANRILAISLPEAENSEAVKNSRQIVVSMDPYYAFAEPESISSDQVSEGAVNIERLDWKSGLQIAEAPPQPNWATSLGISMDKPAEENIPEWLKTAEAPAAPSLDEKASPGVSPFIWDTQEVEKIITDTSKPEGEIPDWMKDAGWSPSTGEPTSPVVASLPPEENTTPPGDGTIAPPVSEDLEQANIPEWLRGIAPEDFTGTAGQQTKPEGDTLSNPWLEPHQPGPTDSIIHWLEEKQPDASTTPQAQGNSFAFPPDEEVPDWLKDLDTPPSATPQGTPFEKEAALTSVPSAFLEEPPIPAGNAELEIAPIDKAVEPAEQPAPEQAEPSPFPETVAAEEPAPSLGDDIPDWLKEIAVAVPAAEIIASNVEKQAEAPSPEVEPVVEPLASIEQSQVTQVPLADNLPAEAEKTTPEEMHESEKMLPDSNLPLAAGALLAAEMLAKHEDEPDTGVSPVAEVLPPAEVPLTLESPPGTGAVLVAENVFSEPSVHADEFPTAEQTPQLTDQPQVDQLIHDGDEIPISGPDSMNEADAFAWLEGLAAEQDAMEEGLVTQPVEGEFQPPEWVKLEMEPLAEEPGSMQHQDGSQQQALPAEEIPDWLKGLGDEPQAVPASEPPFSIATPQPEQTTSEQAEAEAENLDELPAWILDMEQPEPEKEIPGPAEEELEWKLEELPDWLKEITESEGTVEPISPQEPVSAADIATAAVISELPKIDEAPEEVDQTQKPVSAAGIAAAGVIAGLVHQDQTAPPLEEVEHVAEVPPAEVPMLVQAEPELSPVVEELNSHEAVFEQPAPIASEQIPVEAVPEPSDVVLSDARNALNQGQPSQAAGHYTSLIKQNSHLTEIIKDLQDALYRFPVDIDLWVTLGDAQYHNHDLQEALNAYTKAEELVR